MASEQHPLVCEVLSGAPQRQERPIPEIGCRRGARSGVAFPCSVLLASRPSTSCVVPSERKERKKEKFSPWKKRRNDDVVIRVQRHGKWSRRRWPSPLAHVRNDKLANNFCLCPCRVSCALSSFRGHVMMPPPLDPLFLASHSGTSWASCGPLLVAQASPRPPSRSRVPGAAASRGNLVLLPVLRHVAAPLGPAALGAGPAPDWIACNEFTVGVWWEDIVNVVHATRNDSSLACPSIGPPTSWHADCRPGMPAWHALICKRAHGGIPSWHALIWPAETNQLKFVCDAIEYLGEAGCPGAAGSRVQGPRPRATLTLALSKPVGPQCKPTDWLCQSKIAPRSVYKLRKYTTA